MSVSAEEEPMDVSLEYSEGDCQPEGEGLVVGETQQQQQSAGEEQLVRSQKTKSKPKRVESEGSYEDDMRVSVLHR